jgi:hypothetical protein
MFAFEKRWAEAVLSAFTPPGEGRLAPAPGEVDFGGTMGRLFVVCGTKMALGFRLSLWIAALAPIWMWGKLSTAVSLSVARRTELLRDLCGHRLHLLRELGLLLKLAASLALLGTPTVLARTHYDDAAAEIEEADDAVKESGDRLRTRRLLPLAQEA